MVVLVVVVVVIVVVGDNCSLLDQHFSALIALLGTFVTLGTFLLWALSNTMH